MNIFLATDILQWLYITSEFILFLTLASGMLLGLTMDVW